jgi:hypothetical protein
MIKEQQAGFRKDQLFMDNIGRIGHVFASDPLINLIDLLGSGARDKNDLVALGSSVSGARFGALLRVVCPQRATCGKMRFTNSRAGPKHADERSASTRTPDRRGEHA